MLVSKVTLFTLGSFCKMCRRFKLLPFKNQARHRGNPRRVTLQGTTCVIERFTRVQFNFVVHGIPVSAPCPASVLLPAVYGSGAR